MATEGKAGKNRHEPREKRRGQKPWRRRHKYDTSAEPREVTLAMMRAIAEREGRRVVMDRGKDGKVGGAHFE
jgi:hypothetical protein